MMNRESTCLMTAARVCGRRKQLAAATSSDVEHGSYSVKLADNDVSDDVSDAGRLMVRLCRNEQLGFGFGFSAADERPTIVRSVIKGQLTSMYPARTNYAHNVNMSRSSSLSGDMYAGRVA